MSLSPFSPSTAMVQRLAPHLPMRLPMCLPMHLLMCLLIGVASLLSGCEKSMQNMYDQPRRKPYAASELFPDGASARLPPPGTHAYAKGPLAGTSSGLSRHGVGAVAADAEANAAQTIPYPVDETLLARGRERYTIYCQPCHSPLGDGDGLIVRHGFPRPPSFADARLRQAPDRLFYDVITHGYGIMYPYADRVAPTDRWAIVAYIRALQIAAHMPVAALSADARRRIAATAMPDAPPERAAQQTAPARSSRSPRSQHSSSAREDAP